MNVLASRASGLTEETRLFHFFFVNGVITNKKN